MLTGCPLTAAQTLCAPLSAANICPVLKGGATVIDIRVIHLKPCAVCPWCVTFSVSVGISALFLPEPHPYSHCSALPSVSYPVCSLVHAVGRLKIGTSPPGISTTHPPPFADRSTNMSVQSKIVWYQAPVRHGEKYFSRLCTIQQSHCCDCYKISHGLLFAV